MALKEFEFPSHNGRDRIQAWIHLPATETPQGIVQIVHGLGEHSRRYLRLISHLLDEGYVVAADDHAGHGRTAMVSGTWADTGEHGNEAVVEDEKALHDEVTSDFPGLPFVLLGHSWGSMIARAYAARYPGDLAGLALCGVAAHIESFDAFDLAALEADIGDTDGSGPGEVQMAAMFDGFLDRYDDPQGPTDWVARDRGVVFDHARDPLNRFGTPMSLRFVHDFVTMYRDVNDAGWAGAVPAGLPVLILAGAEDPVAGYGEGAYEVANALQAGGHRDVRTRVYPGVRHEVHNEPPTRDDVEAEIVGFADRVSGRSVSGT